MIDISISCREQSGEDATTAWAELITVSAADFAQDAVGAEQCQTASDGGGLAALLDFAGGFGGIEQAAQITIAQS